MELPFTIVFEPPSRSELRALLRMRGAWAAGLIVALTIGTADLLATVAHADASAAAGKAPLALRSDPPGAVISVDGHQRGVTPLDLPIEPGLHNVLLKAPRALDGQYSVDVGTDGAALDTVLWQRSPTVAHLRPALPGATLSDVRVLQDGELGLAMTLPPGHQLQAWRLDPSSGVLQLVMESMPGSRLAFAADGHRIAYLGSAVGPPRADVTTGSASSPRSASAVWLFDADASTSAPLVGWRPDLDPGEQLVDVSWSPRADRLLVVASQALPGGAQLSRGWFLSTDGRDAEPAFSIPSGVAPGTSAWNPNGDAVAFVARAGQVNALCLVGVDGAFHYLADLDPSNDPPLSYAPLNWSVDGQRLLFIAPHQHLPGVAFDWLVPEAQHAMYVADVARPVPSALADTVVDQVTWREDGQVLGLWRSAADAPLSIRLLNTSGGTGQELVQLPLKPASRYATLWDLGRAQLLVTSRNPAAGNDYWLVRLGLEADR